MFKPGNDEFRLFGSLGPDEAKLQAAANMTAHDAELRWPMLKSTHPRKWDLAPELSEQNKAHRVGKNNAGIEGRKPALTLPPELDEKMAVSLSKMAARPKAVSPKVPVQLPPTPSVSKAPQAEFVRPRGSFLAAMQPAVVNAPSVPLPGADNLLSSIFMRLTVKDEPIAQPPIKRASFLSKLGRR